MSYSIDRQFVLSYEAFNVDDENIYLQFVLYKIHISKEDLEKEGPLALYAILNLSVMT